MNDLTKEAIMCIICYNEPRVFVKVTGMLSYVFTNNCSRINSANASASTVFIDFHENRILWLFWNAISGRASLDFGKPVDANV